MLTTILIFDMLTTVTCSHQSFPGNFRNIVLVTFPRRWHVSLTILAGCLMQVVSNTKVNSSQPLSLQLVCNQGSPLLLKQPISFYSLPYRTEGYHAHCFTGWYITHLVTLLNW